MSQSEKALAQLREGELKIEGRFIYGSNYTFLVKVFPAEAPPFLAVYKPVEGERSLWDFPEHTLAQREVAAFLVAETLGWQFVPPTVFREDGPYGAGSVQLFIEHDPDVHYFNFNDAQIQKLRPVVLFDLLINNADRKGGHVILGENQQVWLIDHGVCFHVDEKLRTVLWDFAGEAIPSELREDLENFSQKLGNSSELQEKLAPFLSVEEVAALAARAKDLSASTEFSLPPEDRRAYPYPPV